ncbi:MAG: IS1595 family transposase [Armatimonadetes bacterium]|nr:IS1595 family transposase [Armatimonadota bacterium]
MKRQPTTLLDVVTYFADERRAFDHFIAHRFPNGVACPRCGCVNVKLIETRLVWRCNGCTRQFSAKVGTIFEDSPVPLSKWLPAMWLIANCKNGVSSYEIARDLKVTQKTAWFMMHRIRMAMETGTFEKLSGHVEADECYIGGRLSNKHKKGRKVTGRGMVGKTTVLGALQRDGRVTLEVARDSRGKSIQAFITSRVEPFSNLYTDSHNGYVMLRSRYHHYSVDHMVEYVRGVVHTNGMENFWSLLKRSIKGTYICPSPWQLHRYCSEQEWRYNNKGLTDGERFSEVLSGSVGRRLTYARLTGKPGAAGWTTV